MSDDPLDRDTDLSLREAASGGPQQLVDSLVAGLARQRRLLTIVTWTVVLDIVLSLVLAFVVYYTNSHAADNRRQTAVIATNQWNACNNSRANQVRFNAAMNALAEIEKTQVNVPSLAAARIAAYKNAQSPLLDCGPKP